MKTVLRIRFSKSSLFSNMQTMPIRNALPLQQLPKVSLKQTKTRDFFKRYEIRDIDILAALLNIRWVYNPYCSKERETVFWLKIMPVSHMSANINLLWGRRKWTFPAASTAHHGTAHCVMQHSHCWRSAHSGLTQGSSRHSVLYDPHQERFVPGLPWAKDSSTFWLYGLIFHRN